MEGKTPEQTIENLNAQVISLDSMNTENLKSLHLARTEFIIKNNQCNQLIKQIEQLNKEKQELIEKVKQLEPKEKEIEIPLEVLMN